MDGYVLYDFRIDAWTPETLPMKRLSDYANELAKLFGSTTDVHLLKVRKGSAVSEIAVAANAQHAVAERLALVGTAQAPEELRQPYSKVNDFLREDGGSAVLKLKGGARVVAFPGCKTPLAEEVVIHEAGTLDGVVIRVGGKDETVPVWLLGENDEKLQCNSSRQIAKELALHLFGSTVRVSGLGKWRRNSQRVWQLEQFDVKSWETLDGKPLEQMVTELREVPGNGWTELQDPQAEWRRIRGQG